MISMVCDICGAAILESSIHEAWHQLLDERLEQYND